MATQALTINNQVSIHKDEYVRLKRLDHYFKGFLGYLDYLNEIQEARDEVKQGDIISQEQLFNELGLQ